MLAQANEWSTRLPPLACFPVASSRWLLRMPLISASRSQAPFTVLPHRSAFAVRKARRSGVDPRFIAPLEKGLVQLGAVLQPSSAVDSVANLSRARPAVSDVARFLARLAGRCSARDASHMKLAAFVSEWETIDDVANTPTQHAIHHNHIHAVDGHERVRSQVVTSSNTHKRSTMFRPCPHTSDNTRL